MLAHPSLPLLSANFTREDLFLVVYCVVDDWMKARYGSSNAPRKRRGPRSDECSDGEVLTVLLVGELCHCWRERAWLRQVRVLHVYVSYFGTSSIGRMPANRAGAKQPVRPFPAASTRSDCSVSTRLLSLARSCSAPLLRKHAALIRIVSRSSCGIRAAAVPCLALNGNTCR